MKKLKRVIILSILFILLWIVAYSIIPTIALIFGGSFSAVSQNMAYIVIIGLLVIPFWLGLLFSECFDKNFYSKK